MAIKAYKGFNKDMTCRDFQYKEDESYETDTVTVKCCASGFHSCTYPLDCFGYYPPSKSIYHEVEADGYIDRVQRDSKISSTKIKIGPKISILDIITTIIDSTFSKIKEIRKINKTLQYSFNCNPYGISTTDSIYGESSSSNDSSISCNTGHHGYSSNSGICGISCNTGDYGVSCSTGSMSISCITGDSGVSLNRDGRGISAATSAISASAATGNYGVSCITGDNGASTARGEYGVSVNTGNNGESSSIGFGGVSVNTGDSGASYTTGDYGISVTTGSQSTSYTTGDYGICSATGNYCSVYANNPTAIAISYGYRGRAKGVKGSRIVLAEWEALPEWKKISFNRTSRIYILKSIKMVKIDGKRYKPDIWYTIKDGKIVEQTEDEDYIYN